MRTVAVALLVGLGVVGCMGDARLQAMTAGQVGCPRWEIGVSDKENAMGVSTWTAQCRGRVFICSSTNNHVACQPELIPPPDAVAAPAASPRPAAAAPAAAPME